MPEGRRELWPQTFSSEPMPWQPVLMNSEQSGWLVGRSVGQSNKHGSAERCSPLSLSLSSHTGPLTIATYVHVALQISAHSLRNQGQKACLRFGQGVPASEASFLMSIEHH